jgi:hypothetical protein
VEPASTDITDDEALSLDGESVAKGTINRRPAGTASAGDDQDEHNLDQGACAGAPSPLSAPQRIAEILERFFLEDARLTTELLGQLALCTAEDCSGCSALRCVKPRRQPLIRKTSVDLRRPPSSLPGQVAARHALRTYERWREKA